MVSIGTASFGKFKPDKAGIAEIFTSSAMQSFVRENTTRIESAANAQAVAHRAAMTSKIRHSLPYYDGAAFVEDPYYSEFKVLDNVAVGVVKLNTVEGAYDNKHFHTLNHLNA